MTAYLTFDSALEICDILPVLQGKFEECVPLYKKAITIWEKTGGPLLATGSYNNLANVYKQQVL